MDCVTNARPGRARKDQRYQGIFVNQNATNINRFAAAGHHIDVITVDVLLGPDRLPGSPVLPRTGDPVHHL
ncbi:hypothetical protein KEM60_00548 [Austwickia sp. TVS 96-490-7B]|nr:hypothetical protein [Austwickia sp. TVS 96-490-7B]